MTTTDPGLQRLEAELPITRLADVLATRWEQGWHPLDIARLIGADHPLALRAVVDAIALDRTRWNPRCADLWTRQADELGATDIWWTADMPYWAQLADRQDAILTAVIAAARRAALLTIDLPAQPVFEPPPTEPSSRRADAVDGAVLAKVRGLLAKAESTTFDHEAEALAAKAQQLIARHSIDVALLAGEVDVPGGRRIYIDRPYARPKFMLLSAIGRANTCRCVWNDRTGTATIIGHTTDLHLTEVLFTSLLLQGTGAVLDAGSRPEGWSGGTKSWRHAFWMGFAQRIGQRLAAATDTARRAHARETGVDLLPVLVGREGAVDQALHDAFGDLGTLRTSVSNGEGLRAGRRFADRAELDGTRTVAEHPHGELGG